ncbi:MAG: lytic transglycosylase domain-containing protein [Myxococcaceae bacterium]
MRAPLAPIAAVALFAAWPAAASAEGIYRYVEKDGTIVYTNVAPGGAAARKARKLPGEFHAAPSKVTAKAAPLVGPRTAASLSMLTRFDELIEPAARRYRVPANLVRAVMHAESGFDVTAVSPKGASGLMQLMPATAAEMYVKDIFDAKENIEGGTRYLRLLANQFNGDMVQMIAAYNAGPDAVRRYGGAVPPYDETQAYVRRVLSLYFQYKAKSQLAQAEP